MGVAWPGTLLSPPVVSYTTVSPLLTQEVSGLLSVALFQTFTRFRVLPGMLPYGVRTFLEHSVSASIQPAWSDLIEHQLYD